MKSTVEIVLLGDFRLIVDEVSISRRDFDRRSARELTQLLAVTPGHKLGLVEIVEALWPDSTAGQATKRIYKAATIARKALGSADSIVRSGETIALFPDSTVTTDVDLLSTATHDAADVEQALATCRLGLDREIADAPWGQAASGRVREIEREILAAAQRWTELFELDPSDEQVAIEVMHAGIRTGDRGLALRTYEELSATLKSEHGRMPGLQAQQLHEAASSLSSIPAGSSRPPSGRGARVGALDRSIGRAELIERVRRLVVTERVVTLVGAGGVGKTHVARHAAAAMPEAFSGGVFMCQLGKVADEDQVATAVREAVGAPHHADADPVASAIRFVGSKPLLLVIDNCEHLLASVALVVSELVAHCEGLRILTTSRQALGLREEAVVQVGQLERDDARELIAAEVERCGGTIDRSEPALDRICKRLDDLPLALKLAAARYRILGPEPLEAMLDDRLDLFSGTGDPEVAHHDTLRAAIQWSYENLSLPERAMLCDLSSFANEFTLDDMMVVTRRARETDSELVQHFDALVQQSLVSGPSQPPSAPATYRLLESVRLFAREEQRDRGADGRYMHLALERAEMSASMLGHDADEALRRYERDWDDLRRARSLAIAANDRRQLFRMLTATAHIALMTLRFEYLDWCNDFYHGRWDPEASPGDARIVAVVAALITQRGDLDQGHSLAKRSYDRAPSDDIALFVIGWIRLAGGFDDSGAAAFGELAGGPAEPGRPLQSGALSALVIADRLDHQRMEEHVIKLKMLAASGAPARANYLAGLGMQQMMLGQVDAAADALRTSADIAESFGLRFAATNSRSFCAINYHLADRFEESVDAVSEALDWPLQQGVWQVTALPLAVAALTLTKAGKHMVATMILAASTNSILAATAQILREPCVNELRQLVPDDFDAWWRAGEILPLDAAQRLALETLASLDRT